MKFIRTFWGDLSHHGDRHKHEITKASKNKLDEMVYVWGDENEKFIKNLGYQVKKISSDSFEYGDDYFKNSNTFFLHKLMAIKYGIEDYKEIVFLDWDNIQQKNIDKNFFHLLEVRDVDFQIPLYVFPEDYEEIVLKEWIGISETDKKYLHKQNKIISLYNYNWNSDRCIPNTSFIYTKNIDWINQIIKINEFKDLEIISDETPVTKYILDNVKTLDEYIMRFEPLVADAKFNNHFNQYEFKKYMGKFIKKDLYFIHE